MSAAQGHPPAAQRPLKVLSCASIGKTESLRRKQMPSHSGPKPPAGSYQIQLLQGGPSAAWQAASQAACEAWLSNCRLAPGSTLACPATGVRVLPVHVSHISRSG